MAASGMRFIKSEICSLRNRLTGGGKAVSRRPRNFFLGGRCDRRADRRSGARVADSHKVESQPDDDSEDYYDNGSHGL